ncbi:Putative major facilitator superfamily, MFS transporter superfamily [Septoria linicola]|uniref:Major facilitator superfamily, MFS transporter superfamily n=1 Tax=Septoria linicola TaxID=215465 RepID=A0A9Q9APZ9_9PEZI|nr:Putative major facilitator superfamily, MFS transporter superfamily [Septoria linicola]
MSPRNSDDSTHPIIFHDCSAFGAGTADQNDHVAPPMVYKSRHISLHSRIDSLRCTLDGFTDIPLTYSKGRERSDSWLESGNQELYYESEKEDEDHDGEDDDSTSSSSSRSRSPGPDEDRESHPDPRNLSRYHEVLLVGVIIMAQFMTWAGIGQALAPMKFIAQEIVATKPGEQAWFTASYCLTVGTFTLITGRMGDILGHKKVLAFGYFFLGSWSAFSGFSAYIGSQIFFDVCRAFQGVGAALVVPNALGLLGQAYSPGKRKNVVFSLFGVMAPWGLVVGALSASMFAEVAWWPWTFWSYAIAAWVLSALVIVVVPKELAHNDETVERAETLGWDLMGSTVGVLGLILVNVAWNDGPLFGWQVPHVYFLLIIGLLSLAGFFWIETRASSPILSVKAMCGEAAYTLLLLWLGWSSFGIWIYYSFRFLQEAREFSSLIVSAQFVPIMVCGLLAAGATGVMLTHTPVSFTMFASMIAFFVGQLITATQPAEQMYWAQRFVAMLIIPFGMELSFASGTLLLSRSMSPEHEGLAAPLATTVIHFSISIALGIAGTVEVHVNNQGMTREDVHWGIQCAWWTGVALAGCSVVLGAGLFGRSLLRDGWNVIKY